jgi:hypothetical protein
MDIALYYSSMGLATVEAAFNGSRDMALGWHIYGGSLSVCKWTLLLAAYELRFFLYTSSQNCFCVEICHDVYSRA